MVLDYLVIAIKVHVFSSAPLNIVTFVRLGYFVQLLLQASFYYGHWHLLFVQPGFANNRAFLPFSNLLHNIVLLMEGHGQLILLL